MKITFQTTYVQTDANRVYSRATFYSKLMNLITFCYVFAKLSLFCSGLVHDMETIFHLGKLLATSGNLS